VALDNDKSAFEEAVKRSKRYLSNIDVDLRRPIDCRDLERVSEELSGERFDLVICNFAVQYFARTHESSDELMRFVHGHLSGPEALFLGCVMNGNKVARLLDDNGRLSNDIMSI
jgi:chemotaxis methyl-accepting protein methylase